MRIARNFLSALTFAIAAAALLAPQAQARINLVESTQKNAEAQVRRLVEPLLDKYCHDQCKLLSVAVTVDLAVPDEVAPGFDDMQTSSDTRLAPSGARMKLLIDDKVGPISRGKLVELLQQYLETLEYPVKIDTQLAHFPQPVGSEGKVAELRERIAKQFQNTINELISQFCPEHCLLADFDLDTEVVNTEESQYGAPGEFVQEAGVAVRIRDISGVLLMDETLLPEEQANILEMAKLKTNSFRHVSLSGKSMKFPKPVGKEALLSGIGIDRRLAGVGAGKNGEQSSSKEKLEATSTSNNQSTNASTNSNENTTSSSSTNNNQSKNNTQTTNSNSEQNLKQERFERIEKIERVESGDAVQAELQKFKVYGLIFGCSILSLLVFIAMASLRPRKSAGGESTVHRVIQSLSSDPVTQSARPMAEGGTGSLEGSDNGRGGLISRRYEIERLVEELSAIFAQHPKVAKHVFTRILTEEGVETTAAYISIFGESVVVDMLRDPSLQSDLSELMEFYAKTPIELDDEEKLDLLRRLHNRAVAGKLVVLGNRSSNLFDFLAEMDSTQIMELIRTESLTVKAIVLTQCDSSKRGAIYSHLEEEVRMKLLTELSRIDYLPRDYIFNVSNALKRKRRDNPKLNTEALPGSEVLVNLLERTGTVMQRTVVKNLEASNPDSARTVKSKLVSIETLRYLRDGQMLEVVLSLKHDELLIFLRGANEAVRNAVFSKAPKELVVELEEELTNVSMPSREGYQATERKVLNRMKIMANDGLINLIETNERMFADAASGDTGFVGTAAPVAVMAGTSPTIPLPEKTQTIKKVSGW